MTTRHLLVILLAAALFLSGAAASSCQFHPDKTCQTWRDTSMTCVYYEP